MHVIRRAEIVEIEGASVAAEFGGLRSYHVGVTGGGRVSVHGVVKVREGYVCGVAAPHIVDGTRSEIGPKVPCESGIVDDSVDVFAAV